jgi:hypothetical protein
MLSPGLPQAHRPATSKSHFNPPALNPNMSIPTGRYVITNVRQKNSATLEDPNDGTPVTAGVETYMDIAKASVRIVKCQFPKSLLNDFMHLVERCPPW